MAYEMKGPGAFGAKVYNVERAVGRNGANTTSDTKLVQYMLRNIYSTEAAGLKIDGLCGPITISWIERFQKDCKAQGANVRCDGRIDRAFGEVSAISKTTYTILLMNQELQKRNPAAWAGVSSAVPLSPEPRTNPLNPRAKRVVDYSIRPLPNGTMEVTYRYADGTQDKEIATRDIVIGGRLAHSSQIVSMWTSKESPWEHRFTQYADGRVEHTKQRMERVVIANVPTMLGVGALMFDVFFSDGTRKMLPAPLPVGVPVRI